MTDEERRRAAAERLKPYQFKPGNKASQGVRRGKGQRLVGILRRLLRSKYPGDPQQRTVAEVLVARLIVLAMQGNSMAIKQIFDRIDGPVPTTIDGADGPIRLVVEYVDQESLPVIIPDVTDSVE